jgi:hypothetical protein
MYIHMYDLGISLPTNPEARYDMPIKRQAIARFMFNMAFENSIEDGYVTEKPFDALISGIFMFMCIHKNVYVSIYIYV